MGYKVSKATPYLDAARAMDAALQPHRDKVLEERKALLLKFQDKHNIHHSSVEHFFNTRKDNVEETEFVNYDQYVDYMSCYSAWSTAFDRYAKLNNINWYA